MVFQRLLPNRMGKPGNSESVPGNHEICNDLEGNTGELQGNLPRGLRC